ncbi:UNVERIFIED_CONTAM: hypothetical protein Sradi_2485900 [Sesamum radiatum]|uniref:Uncharacterized protein n=1 Tax=Sesamum radiatum TaxID=300843 RepID=A0AAW2SJD6_SESRA
MEKQKVFNSRAGDAQALQLILGTPLTPSCRGVEGTTDPVEPLDPTCDNTLIRHFLKEDAICLVGDAAVDDCRRGTHHQNILGGLTIRKQRHS